MENISLDWTAFKAVVTEKARLRWVDRTDFYKIYYQDSIGIFETSVPQDGLTFCLDFENNYKALGNKSISIQPLQSPFSAKTLANGKSLFKRFTGTSFILAVGSNTCIWEQSAFPWVKFLGLEILGGELGDTCDLYVLDSPTGTYSGIPNYQLNQFAYNANISPNFYKHQSEYDADMYIGIQIKLVYNSVSAKTLRINFDMNEVK